MNRAALRTAAVVVALLTCAVGCGSSAVSGSRAAGPSSTTATTSRRQAAGPTPATTTARPAPVASSPAPVATSAPPPTGSCHARGSGLYVLPDPTCTPGATNPAVTQADIDQTICRSGWTATVRPPESYTEPLKYQQMAAYGDTGSAGNYEEDHLVPLELGGSPTSPRNLWPEPGATPNPKDAVEDAGKRAVCDGQVTLAAAQRAIATDWIALGQQLGVAPRATQTTQGAATCTASASYSSKYGDWDVYVHSDQPGQAVQVTTSGGASASYHADSSGYADVYLHAPASAAGQQATVTVGTATCRTTL